MSKTATDPILADLNPPQREAVTNIHGPALILAGAGSGKTRALTHRIAYMMEQSIQPWQILAVTFTNRAAGEMKSRIKKLLHIVDGEPFDSHFGLAHDDRHGRLPVMGTFHSVCVRILRKDIEKLGRDRSFVIYDSDDQEKLMKNVLREMNIDEKELKPRAALGYIGRFKSEAISPKEASAQATTARIQQIVQAYHRYQAALRLANALDFDDLILETVRLFHELPEVLDHYQETWRYLHVDEYQDTNHAQYLFISMLAQKYRNLCVIGDPDQSIYSFRGADIRNILEFQKEYPDALQIKLEQNYRSTQIVLNAANAVIAANPNRPEKQMWTERREGPKVIVHEVADEKTEAREAIREIEQLKMQEMSLNEQVILYRTNAQSRLFEEACLRAGLPYRILGGMKFYGRKEVKDVLAYLYVILNPSDTLSLLRILNVPTRKLGQVTLSHLQALSQSGNLSLWETLRQAGSMTAVSLTARERMAQFVMLIERMQQMSETLAVSELIGKLISAAKLEEWYRDNTEDGEERWLNVQELLTVAHKYDTLPPKLSLTSFLEEVALVSEVDKLSEVKDDAVTLMTLHLCKGLEFDHVIIGGCEEGIFPHSNSMYDRKQLEEERRIMYVGMTRSKTHLRLMCARTRTLWGQSQANAPSRFLNDLPDELTERRSDELLSAFAWASERGRRKALSADDDSSGVSTVPTIEFNQDIDLEDTSQEQFAAGGRVQHPSFGTGVITSRRGGIVDVMFDDGKKKSFALSIAPLKLLL